MVDFKKIIAVATAAAVISGILTAAAIDKNNVAQASPKQFTVVIDAGHGGIDGGVVGRETGVIESELNLAVAKKLAARFEAGGFSTVLTRSDNAATVPPEGGSFKRRDMKRRIEIINAAAPDLVISIHMNKYSDRTRRGAQVFYQGDYPERKCGSTTLLLSKELAETVQRGLNAMDDCARACITLTGDYYILNYSVYPTILVECGFLSSAEDERLLITDVYQNRLAYVIFCGTLEYLC